MTWWKAMTWFNPPPMAAADRAGLALRTAPDTDFWQTTHYGFRRDSGHFLHRAQSGDFDADVTLTLAPQSRYDQAGLMIRLDAGNWLKTSLEFEPDGASYLGAVVTNLGLSDWSMRPVTAFTGRLRFSVRRRGPDYTVLAGLGEAPPARLRLTRLHGDDGEGPVQVGIYACSPTGRGCGVEFEDFAVTAVTSRA